MTPERLAELRYAIEIVRVQSRSYQPNLMALRNAWDALKHLDGELDQLRGDAERWRTLLRIGSLGPDELRRVCTEAGVTNADLDAIDNDAPRFTAAAISIIDKIRTHRPEQ